MTSGVGKLGSQDGLGGQFFLWGEPLGSQRFQGDDLSVGRSFNGSQFFLGGISTESSIECMLFIVFL